MDYSSFQLTDKIAMVTGPSQGIGRAIALGLAKAGAHLVLAEHPSYHQEALASLKAEIEKMGRKTLLTPLDVGDVSQIRAAFAKVKETFGRLDVLVNNAGITRDTLAMRMKDEDWDAVLDTNLKAVFRVSRAAIRPMMKQRFGRIISITSVVGASGNAGQANYAAAKAGVAGMTRALARELGSRSITVNCVAPGFIETDMTANLPEEQQKALQSQIALGHLGKPADIAHAVAYLASREAGYVTGQELHVNGGMYM